MNQESSPYEVSASSMSSAPSPNVQLATASKITQVFGIIHIVYASLGIVSAFAAVLMMGVLKAMVGKFEGQAKELETLLEAYQGMMGYAYIDMGVKLALGIILLVAGTGLLRKKNWAVGASLFWAVLRMILAVIMAVIAAEPTRAFQEKVSEMQGSGSAEMANVEEIAGAVGNIVGVLSVCIYPIVVLVFLSKKSVKQSLS